MKLSIIIPVFNEAPTVATLLRRVWDVQLKGVNKELIIVESNSKDGSREIVQKFIADHSTTGNDTFQLILQSKAEGKGAAVQDGFKAATGDIILIQDGDLEYDVNDYPALIEPIVDGRAQFVLGSRHLSAGSWKIRKFETNPLKATILNLGGIFFHGLFNLTYGQSLTDPTTMYKVFRRDCIRNIHWESKRFDFDYELLGKIIRAGYPPLEIPISYKSRGFEEGKKIRVFRDPFTWIRAILKFRFARLYVDPKTPQSASMATASEEEA